MCPHGLALFQWPRAAAGPQDSSIEYVRPQTIKKRIRDIRQLLEQAGYAIQRGPHRLASLDDLYRLAITTGIVIPSEIKTAWLMICET